ncbi:VOC family protein [Paenibacillus alkalitolerans]|uniref:VOC family protein n=1 Tax=Paenibacillus alkalitolerans TaxID=2799335 RepID=UPI0018F5E43F|nr:VOC family protein [Paenibacillus alkalitolerans]
MADAGPKLHIISLHEMFVPVRDAGKSADWYKRHFRFQEIARTAGQVTLRLEEGASLVLVESERLNTYECNPFHLKCNDARKAHAELDKSDVFATEPVNWHHYVDFGFKDPDGNRVGVISDPAWAPHPNNYFRLDGIFLGAASFDSTLAWFQDVLGTEIEYDFTVETPSSPEARMCCLRGVPVTVFDSPASVVHGRYCDFLTSDARADYEYLLEKGVAVTDFSETDGLRTFAFVDPEGREFGLIERR